MTEQTTCPSPDVLAAIAEDRLSPDQLRQYEHHLAQCERCCRALETVAASSSVWGMASRFLPDEETDVSRFSSPVQGGYGLSGDVEKLLRFLDPTDDPHSLGRLGGYEVSGVIGSGGMGIVLKAREPALSRYVALKILTPSFWEDAAARERFTREAQAAASIVHDNVIEIYGVASLRGVPYFAMPYLCGDSLQKRIAAQGALSVTETLRIALQIAAGLSAAHVQGVVHRDIKPANILLNAGADRVRVTDFGIAQLTADSGLTSTGVVPGTPQYMSPEQVRGDSVDARSDLFSLGSVIYAMGTGEAPFRGESAYQVFRDVVTAEPQPMHEVRADVPVWLSAIVMRLHAQDPDQRYQDADELASHLEQCLGALQQPQSVDLPTAVQRLEMRQRRIRTSRSVFRSVGVILMTGLCLYGVLMAVTSYFSAPAAAPEAAAPEPVVPVSTSRTVDIRGRVLDEKGKPLAETLVVVVRKTWPGNRYQQEMLQTKTDERGRFLLKEFAPRGQRYAVLMSVVSADHVLVSDYRLVRNGRPLKDIRLTAHSAKPVTVRFTTAAGKPATGIRVLPSQRLSEDGKEHLTYAHHQVAKSGLKSDEKGEVQLGAWQPGETGQLIYLQGDKTHEVPVELTGDRTIVVTVP